MDIPREQPDDQVSVGAVGQNRCAGTQQEGIRDGRRQRSIKVAARQKRQGSAGDRTVDEYRRACDRRVATGLQVSTAISIRRFT